MQGNSPSTLFRWRSALTCKPLIVVVMGYEEKDPSAPSV